MKEEALGVEEGNVLLCMMDRVIMICLPNTYKLIIEKGKLANVPTQWLFLARGEEFGGSLLLG